MKKLMLAVVIAFAVAGGAVAASTVIQPAVADNPPTCSTC